MKKLHTTLLINTLVLFFGGQIFAQSINDLSFGSNTTFDIITWNIERFPKRGSSSVDSVEKLIKILDADLIGLQEVGDSTVCRQMIDRIAGYELFMDNDWFGGLAYVYKTSTVEVQSIYKIYDTSPYWKIFPRSPLVIEFIYGGDKMIAINNHYKCCGDGVLVIGDTSDEEFRRYEANELLKEYIDENFPSEKVIVLGDLNDILTDRNPNNVFEMFINDSDNYLFVDQNIAEGNSEDWSYPNWPSHLDHILITNELFEAYGRLESKVSTIRIDDFISGGFRNYDYHISDHRPVGLNIELNPEIPTSLFKKDFPNFKIVPNPSESSTKINLTDFQGEVIISISDLNGRVVDTKKYQGNQVLNLNYNGPAGIYLVNVESSKGKSTLKWIKQ